MRFWGCGPATASLEPCKSLPGGFSRRLIHEIYKHCRNESDTVSENTSSTSIVGVILVNNYYYKFLVISITDIDVIQYGYKKTSDTTQFFIT